MNSPATLHILIGLAAIILSPAALVAQDEVIGRLNEKDIKAGEIRPFLENINPAERQALASNPSVLNQSVRMILLQRVLLEEALAAGHDKDPKFKEQLKRLQDAAVAESYLQSVTQIPEGFPSEAEIKAVYEARKAELIVPKSYNVSQIYVALLANASKEAAETAKARIDAAAKKVKAAGADFAAIAKSDSEAVQNAGAGGLVGWVAENNLQPEIRSTIEKMSKSAVSDPIKMTDGYYIVKVNDIRESYTATLEEVRPRLTELLRAQRQRANREAYMGQIARDNPIAIDELSLSKLLEIPAKPAN